MHHGDRSTGSAHFPPLVNPQFPPTGTQTYPPMDRRAEQHSDIERRFTHHPPKRDQIGRYQALRDKAKELALLIVDSTPYSREQSTALTQLESAVMFANAAIARNE